MNEDKLAYQVLYEPNSPLQSAPQQIQDYFKSLKSVEERLPDINHGFDPRPSPKHFCTRVLKPEQKFFECLECGKNQSLDTMIFCETCFDKQLHQGHTIQEKPVGNNSCSCDCGRKLRLKQTSFCATHADKNKQVDINEEEARKFNQFFLPLLEIAFFLDSRKQEKLKPVLELISRTLTSLCEDSLYYVRLTSGLFDRSVKQDEPKIGERILNYPQFRQVLMQMMGDRQFLLSFGQVFMKLEAEGKYILFEFGSIRRELLDSDEFLMKMAKQSIYYPSELNNYFALASNLSSDEERNNFISDLLGRVATKIEASQYVDLVCTIMREGESFIFKHDNFLIDILSNVLINYSNEHAKKGEKVQDEGEKKITNQARLALKKSMSIINKIILQKCNENITHYEQCLQKVIFAKQDLTKSFNNLLLQFVDADLFKDLQKQKLRPIMILALYALDKHPNRNELLSKIWLSFFPPSKTFIDNLDNAYQIIAFLANSYRSFGVLGGNQEQLTKLDQVEIKQRLFKSYLFQNKEVSKKDLWEEYNDGWLKFEKCGKILNQLCEYQENTDTFIYKSKLSYPNPLMRIPLELSRNWENIRKMEVSYKWPSLCESNTLRKLILTLFKGEEFFNAFQQNFIKSLETIEKQARTLDRWKNRGVGQNYIIILLLIDKICDGEQNSLIREEIEKIKLNIDQYRFRFTEIGSEDKIKKMLCVDPPEEQQPEQEKAEKSEKNEEQLRKEELIKKSQEKKLKMQNKLKQKQNNTLQKIRNEKTSTYEEEEQNFCLSCKEREKKDNEFVVLVCLGMGNTISKILHAEQSKTSMKVSTNLHTIHINCFKEMKKKNMEFNCPLCKQNVNCFLPYRPNRASPSTLNICWNVFNAVLVSCWNFYDACCLFEIILDALVQSLGFNELIAAKKSKNMIKLKNKSDLHLLQTLTCLYSFAPEGEKSRYKSAYKKLQQKIKTCTRKQLQLFQMVILDAVFFRVTGQIQIEPALVESLSKFMIEDELKILKNTLIFITEGNSDAISSLQDFSMSKIEEQSPTKKVQQELPTSLENLEEPIPQSNEQPISSIKQIGPERKSLGINITTPPRTLSHLFSKQYIKQTNKSGKCGCESSQIETICLICRKVFCEKCEDDKFHEEMHLKNYITLGVKDGRLIIHKGAKQEKQDVYFNDFMIQYKKAKAEEEENSDNEDADQFILFKNKKKKGKKNNKEHMYTLNRTKFNDIVEKFYNLS